MNFVHVFVAAFAIAAASEFLNAQVLFSEDFEGPEPQTPRISHTNGGTLDDIQVRHFGVSDEQAVSGNRSFKVELMLNHGDDVHCTVPVDLPFTNEQDLKVEAKLRVENATCSFGFYYRIPHARLSGLVQRGKKKRDLSGSWWSCLAQEPRLHKSAVPISMHNLALYIRPKPGTEPSRFINDRVVVYVDDIVVTAIPRDLPRPESIVPEKNDGYRIFPVKAMTNQKILPSRPIIPSGMKLDSLELTAAGDEYESGSFAILANEHLDNVAITLAPFTKGDDAISSFDLWAIKCWYQPHLDDDQFGPVVPTLTAELLLHDDDLVNVDIKSIKQVLRVSDADGKEKLLDITGPNSELKEAHIIEDAEALLPVTIPRRQPKQFWFTVYVPPDAPPGEYKSAVQVRPKDADPQTLPVTLNVLPYRLPPPCLEYSIYYNAGLKDDDVPIVSSDYKTESQLEAEFRDMKAHGVTNPNMRDMGHKERYLTIRNRVGLSQERLFLMHGPHSSTDDQLREKMAMFRKLGYKDVYLMGIDEATGDRLAGQRPHWGRARALGFKMFVACGVDFFDIAGDILDAPVLAGPAKPEFAEKIQANGFRPYMYANPQFGQPNPETYRRNFGLTLWKGGYSGAMNYAYQHAQTLHMWNDMAVGIQDKVTYATSSGVVGTLAWEGFREGVDDVRYLTLLLDRMEKAARNPSSSAKADKIREWLEALDPQRDLDVVRSELRDNIAALVGF